MARILITGCIAALLLAVSACSSSVEQDRLGNPKSGPVEDLHSQDTLLAGGEGSGFPSGLPADGLQPWEQLDAQGFIVPADRSAASINGNTDFTPGIQRFLESGDVAANGEASRLNGTDDSGTSYAMYRVSLQDEQPGIVSVDANLLGSGSEYFVGISDYGHARWDWHGPFSDSHVRIEALPEAGGDLTSTLGNAFITVLVNTGSRVDVVGVGVNQYEIADAQAPSAPAGLALSSVAGGIELEWSPVLEADLAGYAVYYASRSFISVHSAGVQRLAYLEGSSRHLLSGLSERTWIAISAVDFSGNESAATAVMDASPLAGDAPALLLTGSAPGGSINDVIQLTASGADSYDWDLDGDGVFEVENDNSGSQIADTSATGIIRPRVRARDASGEAVALGGLSLIITGNSRPVASAVADPQSGPAPLDVTFTGTAEDSEDESSELSYAWDFDGDGIFEDDTDTLSPAVQNYTTPGLYGVKFRVEDSQGAWDADTVPVLVSEAAGPVAVLEINPNSVTTGELFTLNAASSSSDGNIVLYEWDTDGDGSFETATAGIPQFTMSMAERGYFSLGLRVTDESGAFALDSAQLVVRGWSPLRIVDDSTAATGQFPSIAIVNGNPAISYSDLSDNTVRYVRAVDPQASNWGSPQLIATVANPPFFPKLVIVNGNPAICFLVLIDNELRYMRSLDSNGTAWSSTQLLDSANAGSGNDMIIVDGNPAIAYSNGSARLRYIRASDATGTSWSTPQIIDDGIQAAYASMQVVEGRPAIACMDTTNDHLVFSRAQDATGLAWDALLTVDDTANTGTWADMQIVNGMPAVVYINNIEDRLLYVRALAADGSSWGEPQDLAEIIATNSPPSLELVHGNPAILFNAPGYKLSYMRSQDPAGQQWDPALLLLPDKVTTWPDLTVLNGSPLMCMTSESASLGFMNYLP
ncbi:MAG: hypothetical protein H7A35_04150 [Planctomycetales bacterium]|nr:MAG: hypothetical protein H7A35_04150 [Planctomycetales bacterium]